MSTQPLSNNSDDVSKALRAGLDEILITEHLSSRPHRLPGAANENKALKALAHVMANAPERLPDTLLHAGLELCGAGTAGLSLLETTPSGDVIFRWTHLAGALKGSVGGFTPRDFSPCGISLDRKSAQLFSYPARRFQYLEGAGVPIVEALVVPLGGENPRGTIWILSHDEDTHFDAEDVRIMTSLGDFTSSALRIVELLESERRARQNAESDTEHVQADLKPAQLQLEQQARDRTAELEEQVAERNRAESILRELTGKLLRLRDDEQRRLARELHDSVGQMLAAISMNTSIVAAQKDLSPEARKAVSENSNLISQISDEIRTISHLLHPPLLDEVGLASGVRWYLEGFAERSNTKVELQLAEDFGRLPAELETAVFRLVQESLTNVHRHSESPVARVKVARSSDEVTLEVSDEGKGIPQQKIWEIEMGGAAGVGLSGMRERVRQLGGKFEIRSNGKGTVISARLPLGRTYSSSQRSA